MRTRTFTSWSQTAWHERHLPEQVAALENLALRFGHPLGLAFEELDAALRHHKDETEQHEQRLRERLDALGRGTSTRKEAQTVAGSLVKGVADQVRGDQAGKNARDTFTTEYMDIASYELLERLANRAGDTETAEVARTNRAEDEAMAQRTAANWDKFVDLTLAEEGVQT